MRKIFVVEMKAFQNLLLAFDFHFGINGSQMLFDSRDADEEGEISDRWNSRAVKGLKHLLLGSSGEKIPADLGKSTIHHIG